MKQLGVMFEFAKKESTPLYMRVKVVSKAAKTEIVDVMEDDTYKIRVAAVPLKGKANAELIKFLKKALKANEVVIISGQRDSVKLLRIS